MFPKDLLVVSRRKGKIQPNYLDVDDRELAEEVIRVFKNSKNQPYKLLKTMIKELEKGRNDYKIVRALAELVNRKCEFIQGSNLNSKQVRTFLFEKGFVLNEDQRMRVLREAAKHFETTVEEVENAMFADLPREQVLESIPRLTWDELIKQYNLSQTQTLIFNALELIITFQGEFQRIFRMINFFGLIYEIHGNVVKITGPTSIFKKTRKYGTRLAKLVPFIINTQNWSMEAKIDDSYGKSSKIYTFELNSSSKVSFPKKTIRDDQFDSQVERQFYIDFKNFLPQWEIKREPRFIKAGNFVIIPDFGFYRYNLKIYMEVVGFWTESYIKKKIEKFKQLETPVLVALNENLNCSKEDFEGEVILYKDRIPIKPVIKLLREYEETFIQKELDSLQDIEITEDIIDIQQKSVELNISPDVLEKATLPNHFLVGSKLVSKSFLKVLDDEIGEKRAFSEVKKILDKYELTDKALNLLGFEIIWDGLIPVKIKKSE
ncbi:MAG: hypothetical protein BAJALOKI2v1_840020 [Promethearchaeota archaeon]|nr:MAG: hypothetical protein BAJALOKI2v1_840020 [Candidatus Lokiarchaeota archaeon]